jgi:phosphoglycerate kinase
VSGRRVLVRADLNVPFDKQDPTVISDDGRIRAVLPTLTALRTPAPPSSSARTSGRPKGAPDPKYTLRPVAARLGELLGAR